MLEADGRNFQVHGLPGSADDLLQWFEEMSSVFDKQPHYPVGTLDAAYQTDSLDGAQVSFGRQAAHFDDLPALHLGEESVEGAHRNELSLVHDSKTVAQSLRLLHVVRGVENSCTGFAQAAHNFENVRGLREAGAAILYTTHYMEEAEGLCDRLGIMNQGKLVAMGTLDALLTKMECGEIIEVRGLPPETDLTAVEVAGLVCRVDRIDGVVRLFVKNATHLLEPLQKIISRSRQAVHLKITPISLEHLFLQLTGSELRD